MTSRTIADYLKYANLQTAAEAFIRDPDTGFLHAAGQDLANALVEGNKHTSKFTKTQADAFAVHWEVIDQRANTSTGFSGTLFKCKLTDPSQGLVEGQLGISFRSNEFIDDAVRDNLATNTYELKNTGFAWGQMSDMEAWYAELQADSTKIGGKAFSVTGYSLATAFNLMHQGVAQQVVTFNGAGVGKVKQGNLLDALTYFTALRNDPSLVEARLTDSGLTDKYRSIRSHLADKTWTIDQAKLLIFNAYPAGQMSARAQDIFAALDEIDTMIKERARVPRFMQAVPVAMRLRRQDYGTPV